MQHHPHETSTDSATPVQQDADSLCNEVQHREDESNPQEDHSESDSGYSIFPQVEGVCPITRRKPLWEERAERARRPQDGVAPLCNQVQHVEDWPTPTPIPGVPMEVLYARQAEAKAADMVKRVTGAYGTPHELSEKQLTAIELLLTGKTDLEIAEQLDIHRTTLWRWRRRDENFRRVLAAARERAFRDAGGRLRELVHKALDVLQSKLTDDDNYQAAVSVLRLARFDRDPSKVDAFAPDPL